MGFSNHFTGNSRELGRIFLDRTICEPIFEFVQNWGGPFHFLQFLWRLIWITVKRENGDQTLDVEYFFRPQFSGANTHLMCSSSCC